MKLIKRKYFFVVLVILLCFGVGFKTAGDYFEISRNMDIFGKLYTEINRTYVDETNPTELMRISIDSMLKTLDPYTNFYSESQIENSKLYSTGQYSSVGAEVGLRNGKVLILELYENGPADSVGLRVGDQLIKIDNEQIAGSDKTLDNVNNLLLGERDTKVGLTIRRPGEDQDRYIEVKRGGTQEQQENVPFYGMATEEGRIYPSDGVYGKCRERSSSCY